MVGQDEFGGVRDCYSAGSVNGHWLVGGLVGNIYRDGYGNIMNSYSISVVDGNDFVGGLIGNCPDQNDVSACFWDIETSGQASSAGGEGKTTVEMQDVNTYVSAGWDFDYDDGDDADWFIQIEEYSILVWQISPADIYTDGRNDFRDFAVFAEFWLRDDCAIYNYYCDWADLDFDGDVDIDDLAILMDYWLERGIYN